MTLGDVETRVLNFLGSDTVERPTETQAERYAMINEAYVGYIAMNTSAWITSQTATPAAGSASFVMGNSLDGQWIECETLEVWDNVTLDPDTGLAVYRPLKHRNEGEILFLTRSQGAVGPPRLYSLALRNRSLSATRSQFTVRVYPTPDLATSYTYRARIRAWPTTQLTVAGDILQQMDDEQAEMLAVQVAARIASVEGYQSEHIQAMIERLPDHIRAEFDINDILNWPFSEPRRIGEFPRTPTEAA